MTGEPDKSPLPAQWVDYWDGLLKGSEPYKSGRQRPNLWQTVRCGNCGAAPGEPCIMATGADWESAHVVRIHDVGEWCLTRGLSE
jgi:hypothetical protein